MSQRKKRQQDAQRLVVQRQREAAAGAAELRLRVEAGELSRERVELAAWVGDLGARSLCELPISETPAMADAASELVEVTSDHLVRWRVWNMHGSSLERELRARLAIAALNCVWQASFGGTRPPRSVERDVTALDWDERESYDVWAWDLLEWSVYNAQRELLGLPPSGRPPPSPDGFAVADLSRAVSSMILETGEFISADPEFPDDQHWPDALRLTRRWEVEAFRPLPSATMLRNAMREEAVAWLLAGRDPIRERHAALVDRLG